MDFENFVYVKDSGIHGNGIFTSGFIPQDSLIMIIKGEIISEKECIKREEEGNVYIFWNFDSYIDVEKNEVIKYINHSCECNCYVDDFEGKLSIYALRDIQPDEELTIDYGYDEIYEECSCENCVND